MVLLSVANGIIKDLKSSDKIGIVLLKIWTILSLLTGIIVNETNINRLNSIWYVLIILGAMGVFTLYEKVSYKKIYQAIITFLYIVLFIVYTIYFYTNYVKIVDQSGCFSKGFCQCLNYVKNLDRTTILYDNIKNNGCLQLYIEFNYDSSKKYISITDEEELRNKINNIEENEVLILDVEYKNYPNANYDIQIGDFLIIK